MGSSRKNELLQDISTITKQKERFIFMTVPKSKRQKSRFEVFHNMQTLQKELVNHLMQDFGITSNNLSFAIKTNY